MGICVCMILLRLCFLPVRDSCDQLIPTPRLFSNNHFFYTTGTSSSRNPWLTALSKAHMQQGFSSRVRQFEQVSPSPICSNVYLVHWQSWDNYLPFLFPLILLCGPPGRQSTLFYRFSFCCCWLSLGLFVWSGLSDLFACQNSWELSASHFPGQILVMHILLIRMVKCK